jgi:hypothetical protein
MLYRQPFSRLSDVVAVIGIFVVDRGTSATTLPQTAAQPATTPTLVLSSHVRSAGLCAPRLSGSNSSSETLTLAFAQL